MFLVPAVVPRLPQSLFHTLPELFAPDTDGHEATPSKSHTTALSCAPSTRIPHVSHPEIPRHTPGGNEEGVMILRQTNQAPGNAPFLGILNSHPFPAHHESDAMPGFFVIMPANVVLPLHATPPILQAGNGSNRYNSSPTPSFYMPSSGG